MKINNIGGFIRASSEGGNGFLLLHEESARRGGGQCPVNTRGLGYFKTSVTGLNLDLRNRFPYRRDFFVILREKEPHLS